MNNSWMHEMPSPGLAAGLKHLSAQLQRSSGEKTRAEHKADIRVHDAHINLQPRILLETIKKSS